MSLLSPVKFFHCPHSPTVAYPVPYPWWNSACFVCSKYLLLVTLPFRDACSLWPQHSHRRQPASVSQQPHPHRYYSHFLLSIWPVTDCVRGKRRCRHILKQLLQNSDILILIMRWQHHKESCTDPGINIRNASSCQKCCFQYQQISQSVYNLMYESDLLGPLTLSNVT